MVFVSHELPRWTSEQKLGLLGRSNQLLKRHGEWIDASPLQQLLERQPDVRRCQVFGAPVGIWGDTSLLRTLNPVEECTEQHVVVHRLF